MDMLGRYDFCIECREERQYRLKKVNREYVIKDKPYDMTVTVAICDDCGAEMDVPGLMDYRALEVDRQYREIEGIISISDIQKLMDIYNIGKAPLSLALGFGEITVTRYLQGQVPSKEYSGVMKKALESPKYMIKCLKENKEKIGDTAYRKAYNAATELCKLFNVSSKLLSTISYMFRTSCEITPLALQKMLYFVQGIHLVKFDKAMYNEDCIAWIHGPVYKEVYEMFKDFKYNPIEDDRFAVLKNRFDNLTGDEKEIVDNVIESFGMYSGRALEKITHKEKPWIQAREGYLPDEPSNVVIEKDMIKSYFDEVSEHFDLSSVDGLKEYIDYKLNN